MNPERKPRGPLTTADAATLAGVSVAFLNQDRRRAEPTFPYIRIGRAIRYDPRDIEATLRRHTVGALKAAK